MLVTILLFKIKVVLCMIIYHHHHHRFEKKIKIRERSQRRSIFYETTAEEHIRCGKNKHISSRCRKNTRQRRQKHHKKRESIFIPSAWLGARKAFQPTLRVYSILCSRSRGVILSCVVKEVFSRLSVFLFKKNWKP